MINMRKFIPFLIGSTVYCQEKNNFFTSKEINHKFKNVYQIDGQQTIHLLSILRNKDTDIIKFRQITDRLTRILLETGLSLLEKVTQEKQTPLDKYTSKELKCDEQDICIVSILRSGNTFLNSCLQVLPKATIGQILVQRHQETHKPIQYYESLPSDLSNKQIFLVDPMIATGGSAKQVLEILIKHGAEQPNIIFLNIVSCEVGIKSIQQEYPNIKIITVSLDPVLTPNCYLSPGLGDYGDRYFGTQ